MPRPRTAATVIKSAPLSEEFGMEHARRLFGDEAVASLPLYKAGPNKGKLKAHVIWRRTTEAGYHPNAGGGVGAGVTVRAWIGASSIANEGDALQGNWLGRTQPLCGSACFLGQEARDKEMARQRREEEERLAVYAGLDADAEESDADAAGPAPR